MDNGQNGANPSNEHHDLVHGLRKEVDAVMMKVKEAIQQVPQGQAEMTLAFRKMQEGKMWLGKVLEELGSELPAEFQDKADAQSDPNAAKQGADTGEQPQSAEQQAGNAEGDKPADNQAK